ncbi:MAG: IS1595 family transposase [Actinomycetota bacterium]|nr:IS1595 family transposase [Actinomycetota bacterium]
MKLTLKYLSDHVHDETDAYQLLEELRWHGTPVCSHCGHDKAYFLKPRNGVARGTGLPKADGKRSQSVRRVWKCAKCRKQFSVLTGTIFHGTKIPLQTWLAVMVQLSSAKNGISGREIERMHGLTPETAWYMLHRLREAMKREPMAGLLSGTIVADETFIGGKPKNKHQSRKGKYGAGSRADLAPKTAVLSLVNTETGEVRSRVVPNVTGATLRDAVLEQVDTPSSTLYTDAWKGYTEVGKKFVGGHESVDHSAGEYVRGKATTNNAEGYFSQLKRSIDGTHHHVSVEHRYLAEFDYRYTTRKLSDSQRMQRMIDQTAGRRLSYKPLTTGD